MRPVYRVTYAPGLYLITSLDAKMTVEAQGQLDAEHNRVNRAIKALKDKPPNAPKKVAKKPAGTKGPTGQLKKATDELANHEANVKKARQELEKANGRLEAAKRIQQKFTTIRATVQSWKEEIEDDAKSLDLNVENLIQFTLADGAVKALRDAALDQTTSLREQLDPKLKNSAAWNAQQQQSLIKKIKEDLALPARQQHEYEERKKEWETRIAELEGDASTPNTAKWFEAAKANLRKVPGQIQELEAKRDTAVKTIFAGLRGIREVYRKMYGPAARVSETTNRRGSVPEFRAEIVADEFIEGFLEYIDAGAVGTFQGKEAGRTKLREMIDDADFETEEGIVSFLHSIREALERDLRDQGGTVTGIESQLRKKATKTKLLQYLYSLEYLDHRFALRWNGKTLEQLSPGERGTLLLLFFLNVDPDTKPLIIDQPEENLDNHTVFKELVPAIREAKKRRQIVIVTHNPNLAVVCDAEQVIHAEMDKANGNRVVYTTGSIEDPTMNTKILDVLEGTRDAFEVREVKYRLGKV